MSEQARPARPEPAPPMLAALRAGTREHHLALEREWDIPGRIRSRADLSSVLSAMLASWAPLERRLAAVDWTGLRLDPRLGEAADLIRADLAALPPHPVRAGTAPADADVPAFDSLARAAGGRYVLLGSALGGRVIAPTVERRLDLPEGVATGFFRRRGMTPGRDWRDFRIAVAARNWSAAELAQATAAARETFAFVGRAAAPFLADDCGPSS
ncbi:biliverdin-producing heme oxygenase [Micromonospora coerulea]